MEAYVILLRGINVGGKNRVPMAALRHALEELGYAGVSTYIASGNVILRSDEPARTIQSRIEAMLPGRFQLDSALVKVLALTTAQLETVIRDKPTGFGDQPDIYHSDVIFLMDYDLGEAMQVFTPREGVDRIWPGNGVIYSQRLSAERTKSRLGAIVGTPAYRSMTIRSWNTTVRLSALANAADTGPDFIS